MGQVSPYLRRAERGYSHWCPGCEEAHTIPDSWSFDGNVVVPTFNPSIRITGKQRVVVEGKWTGGWVRAADGEAIDVCCHYHLHGGVLKFCSDSTHALAGKNVPLPELPWFLTDSGLERTQ